MIRLREREQSPGGEIANSLSHAVGAVVALVATVMLVQLAARRGSTAALIGASIVGASMLFLYVACAIRRRSH